MANSSLRKASLQSMEAEIESLLKSLESLKDDASDESRKTLKVLERQCRERFEAFAPSAHAMPMKRSRSKPVKPVLPLGITHRNTLGRPPVLPSVRWACWRPTCCSNAGNDLSGAAHS